MIRPHLVKACKVFSLTTEDAVVNISPSISWIISRKYSTFLELAMVKERGIDGFYI
jgi:hypothetical protein